MADDDDLEKFRQEWRQELKKPKGKDHGVSQETDRKESSFEPFNIAEKLLKGQSGKDSLLDSEGLESDAAKELFNQPPKRLRLETEDKEKFREMSKPKSFLDIFLNDLVCGLLFLFPSF